MEKSKIKIHIEELYKGFLSNGYCKDAVKLNKSIGEDYFDTANPHFFTGSFDSNIVMINLNPKRDKKYFNQPPVFKSFENLWKHNLHFGTLTYGASSKSLHKSAFDNRHVQFFKSLEVLNLAEEKTKEDRFNNLAKVLDDKLQWELIPFGSPNFEFKKIKDKDLQPYIELCINVIANRQRDYVLFCGSVFRNLLHLNNVNLLSKHSFKLLKKDGKETKSFYQIINIELIVEKHKVKAAILPQFAQQGAPIQAYAKKLRKFYLVK